MAIQYTGGTNRNDLYAGRTTANQCLTAVNTSLVAAGWTSAAVKEFSTLTVSANPGNNETVTLASKVYTFKTSINNANDGEVFIGAAATNSLDNLKAAINLAAGGGTTYSSATSANSSIEAGTKTATTLVIQAITGGLPSFYGTTETLANGSFDYATTVDGGYKFTSALTPQLLGCKLYVYNHNDGATTHRYVISNISETEVSNVNASGERIIGGSSVDLRVIANKYQCFVFINGSDPAATNSAFWGCGVPWVPNFLTGGTVTAATNATPIQVTVLAHGYTTGDNVTIRGVGGNTAANVTNNAIIVIDSNNFTLNTSVGNGSYTSGGVCAKVGAQIAEAIWACGTGSGGEFIRARFTANTNKSWTALNGSTALNSNGVGALRLACTIFDDANLADDELLWYNGADLGIEPFVGWGTSAASTCVLLGQLWDSVVIRKTLTRFDASGVTGTFDSHDWVNLTGWSGGAINGSLFHVIP